MSGLITLPANARQNFQNGCFLYGMKKLKLHAWQNLSRESCCRHLTIPSGACHACIFHEAGCFGTITDKCPSDTGKKGRSKTPEIISSRQQTSMNANEYFKKFLFGISEEEPFEMPVVGRQTHNIGSFTVFRSEITYVSDHQQYNSLQKAS